MSAKVYEEVEKRFVRYEEGAKIYSMSKCSFMQKAKEAGAVYKVGKMALVNTEIFEQYLELFRQC